MTMIQAATSSSQTAPDPGLSETSLRSSVAQVLNTLTGRHLKPADLANEKLSEDVLYTALLHEKLTREQPALATGLLSSIAKGYTKRVATGDRQPLTRTADAFLGTQVDAGKLKESGAEALRRYALGKAQLDRTATTAARAPRELAATSAASQGTTAVERTLTRVLSNKTASAKSLTTFDERIQKHPKLTAAQKARQADVLDRIFSKNATTGKTAPTTSPPTTTTTTTGKGTTTTKSSSGTSSTAKKPASTETDKSTALPSAKTIATGPNDLAWKPNSEKDGKALLMLPLLYSGKTIAVDMLNDRGDEKGALKHSGNGDDGRQYWRSSMTGKQLKDVTTFRLRFTDSSQIFIGLPDAGEFYSVRYAAP